MDCDDVALLLTSHRPLTTGERDALAAHCASCPACEAIRVESVDRRWIAQLPEAALVDGDLDALPTIDPIVFARGDELARGGMGRISRVRDRRLARDLALKEILAPDLRARFEREIRITATLQHPAIVPIYEAGMWPDGTAFYTMRLVRGRNLAEAIADAMTIEARLALLPNVIAAAEAVAHAHARRIVHRDLKPSNVLVGDFGETVVIDWGLAKELDADEDPGEALTRAGTVIGTAGYMPPEQASGEAVDERADVFALGAILYHVISGSVPYLEHRASATTMLAATLAGPPRSLDEIAPRAPAELRAIVARAMDRAKELRFANAGELASALRAFAAGRVIAREPPRRRGLAIAAVAVGGVIVAAAIAMAAAYGRSSELARRIEADDQRRASDQRAERAEQSLAALLEERGRVELVAGAPDRALPYLAAAYARGRAGVALRYMLAAATRARPIEPVARIDAGADDASREIMRALHGRPAGRALVQRGGASTVFEAETGRELATIRGNTFALSHDGAHVAVCDGSAARVVAAAGGAVERELTVPGCATAAISAHGERAAFANDRGIVVIDTTTGAETPMSGRSGLLQLDDAGRRIASAHDGAIAVRELDSGHELVATTGAVFALAFDGQLLATSAGDGTIHIWDVDRSRELDAFAAGAPIHALGWSDDGAHVLAQSAGEAVVWDVHLEERAPLAITALVDHGAWQLDGAVLRAR